jgi:hypothetical protein
MPVCTGIHAGIGTIAHVPEVVCSLLKCVKIARSAVLPDGWKGTLRVTKRISSVRTVEPVFGLCALAQTPSYLEGLGILVHCSGVLGYNNAG